MSKNKQKLELTWIGKDREVNLEPRILVEVPEKSYGDKDTENMLIHGDNLLALKALEQDYSGKIKCIYIDPPYNTGSAFEHYDDNVEHSTWLTLMRERLVILKNLLSEDGYIFIQIDDNEMAYLKVLCDEVIGRNNYINTISVNAKVSAGASGGGEDKKLKKNIEYILLYVKNLNEMKQMRTIYKETELMSYIRQMKNDNKSFKYTSVLYKKENIKHFKTIKDGTGEDIEIYSVGNYEIKSVKQIAQLENITEEQVYNKYYDHIMTTTNAQTSIRTRVWDATDNENNMYIATYIPKTGKNKNKKIDLIFMGKQKVLVIWLKDTCNKVKNKLYKKEKIGTYWDGFSWINVTKEGSVLFPNGKKPESLLERVLTLATDEGDLVLDSFLGSGTTAAVAHKMGRKWIGIELGDHCYTHCEPRLQKVVDGTDQGGISKAINWQGGGGYKFYELAPSLLKKDEFDNWIIEPKYDAEMLAEAMAKHEGYKFSPDENNVYKQGFSTEKDFIFTTTQFLSVDLLNNIHNKLEEDESLLICATHFEEGVGRAFSNITVKKIPQMLLDRCEFGKLEYNLNIVEETQPEDFEEDEISEDEE